MFLGDLPLDILEGIWNTHPIVNNPLTFADVRPDRCRSANAKVKESEGTPLQRSIVVSLLFIIGLVGPVQAESVNQTWFDLNPPAAAQFRRAVIQVLRGRQFFENQSVAIAAMTENTWIIRDKRAGKNGARWVYWLSRDRLSGPFVHEDEVGALVQLNDLLKTIEQAAEMSKPQPFTVEETEILQRLCETILAHPHGYVRIAREGGSYRISFLQASDIFLFTPSRGFALRMESDGRGGFRPTRDYGHRDFTYLTVTVAGEADEPIPPTRWETENTP